jgi:hypothetical protein
MTEERVHGNTKYRFKQLLWAMVTWIVLYFGLGMAMGHYLNKLAGIALMSLGAVLFAFFWWRSFRATRLVADRDGFRIDCNGRACVKIGYEKIHEARWEKMPETWARVFGPLVFAEPIWFAQCRGDMCLVVVHAGDPLVLHENEFENLAGFMEDLKKRNIAGLVDQTKRPAQRAFGKDR